MDKTFPEWLQSELDKRLWTQSDLERESRGGISSSQISRILNGTRGVDAPSLRAIAKALRISQAEVFYAAGQQTEKPGDPVLANPILADIWHMLDGLGQDDLVAARVLIERFFGGRDAKREAEDKSATGRS